MRSYRFATLDVFTRTRFGGNPLAIFPQASGLSALEMQALALELNLSETAFVLPPRDERRSASVRIFTPTRELPFAGHPTVGVAYLLAREGYADPIQLEVGSGLVGVSLRRDASGEVEGASIDAPQPLTLGRTLEIGPTAVAVGLDPREICLDAHDPVLASVGVQFGVVQVTRAALARARPDVDGFTRLKDRTVTRDGRMSLLLYARELDSLIVRMFAPLDGIAEDPATGSANAALAALLLSIGNAETFEVRITQGVQLGRPSELFATAKRSPDGIRATVGGACVPMSSGTFLL